MRIDCIAPRLADALEQENMVDQLHIFDHLHIGCVLDLYHSVAGRA